jgi:6-phosphofructokinase
MKCESCAYNGGTLCMNTDSPRIGKQTRRQDDGCEYYERDTILLPVPVGGDGVVQGSN